MCRGFQQNERDRLKIKAFYVQLSVACTKNKTNLPDSLTLHYLPRINGTHLEINGSNIRPDSPAFLTLHRVLSNEESSSSKRVVYGCREKVVACEGVRFEVYVNDVKVLKGSFTKDEEGQKWKMGCKCDEVLDGLKDAEVSLAVDGRVDDVAERVTMVVKRRRKNRCFELEEIPEEREEEKEDGLDVCWCSECGGDEEEMDGGDEGVEMEGVRWAVDVGIWVVCLGVGYLVSRASTSKKLSRRVF